MSRQRDRELSDLLEEWEEKQELLDHLWRNADESEREKVRDEVERLRRADDLIRSLKEIYQEVRTGK